MKLLKREGFGIGLIAAGIVWFYVFLAGGYEKQPYGFSSQSLRYYHLLVDGFVAGQLSLRVTPPPELARMADPYDPVQRGDLGMHDATYYKGRYFLYFGVGPALAVFLPFRVLTGVHFSENLAVGLFCVGGYLASLALFLGLRKHFFPRAATVWVYLGVLLLGLGNFCPVMLVRSDFWEVPIAGAFCFSCLGLLALWQGTVEAPGDRRWLWLASAALGLAVACRPHFVFASGVLGLVWLARWSDLRRRAAPSALRTAGRDALALLVPLIAIVAGLLVYNYQRFDDPLEFGQKYQIGGVSMRHFAVMNWKFIPINFYFNFLARAQFERYFPFVEVIRGYPGLQPPNYLGFENPFGVLPNLPAVWLAFMAPGVWFVSRRPPGLGRWLLILGWHFAAIAGVVLLFGGATNRYMVDFLPSMLLLAGVTLLAGGEWCRRWGGRLAFAAAAILVIGSSAFTVLAAIQYNGLFKLQHPTVYTALARWSNRPVYAWERWRGNHYGPLQLTVTFPKDQPGRPEPILITGVAFHSDYLYVIYDAAGKSIKLAYDRTNYEHLVSQAIPVDYNVPHQIGIESGTLYPPVNHPFFRGWTEAEIQRAKHTLRVTVDNVPYFLAEHPFFEATPEQISIGTNPLSDNGGRKFTGTIQSVRQAQLPSAVADFAGEGFLRLGVVFPAEGAGKSEPIVATGKGGRGDVLFVTYLDARHVRLGFHHSGEAPRVSEAMEIEPGMIQLLEASLGSFYSHPAGARERELAAMLVVRLNGRTVWLESQEFHPATPPAVGANLPASEACGPVFSGKIVAEQLVPNAALAPDSPFSIEPYWLEAGSASQWGPVRMELKLPADQIGKVEPLLVTGSTASQGDYLWINYPIAGKVLVGYEHTGAGGPHTGLVTTDYSRPQRLEVSLPSLYPPDTDVYFARRPLAEVLWRTTHAQLRLNGTLEFDAKAPAFESPPAAVTFGENKISPAFGKKFSGEIVSVERGVFTPPPGLESNLGELEIIMTRPALVTGQEVLLASGPADRLDLLQIAYLDARHVRFSVKPASGPAIDGPVVEMEPANKHVLHIRWGGLYPDDVANKVTSTKKRQELRNDLRLSVDGRPALSGKLEFQSAVPQTLAIGSAPGANLPFTGRLYLVRRLDL